MSKIDEFKEFLKKKPYLSKLVNDGGTTYQKLFETYDIYGENDEVWNNIGDSSNKKVNAKNALHYLKNIDMDKLEENVSSIEKALLFLEEILNSRNTSNSEKEKKKYKDTSIERLFDD